VRERRISVGLPQLLHDQASDIVRRHAVRAEELGLARLWSLDSVPGSATARVPLLDGPHVLTTAAAVTARSASASRSSSWPPRNPP
jgi:hypothetical protein